MDYSCHGGNFTSIQALISDHCTVADLQPTYKSSQLIVEYTLRDACTDKGTFHSTTLVNTNVWFSTLYKDGISLPPVFTSLPYWRCTVGSIDTCLGLSTLQLVGIIVGVILVAIAVGVVIFIFAHPKTRTKIFPYRNRTEAFKMTSKR